MVDLWADRFLTQCLDDHELFHAKDDAQAINVMLSRLMDLVISAHNLPNMGGVEVLSAASQLQPHAKRVLVGEIPDNLEELISLGIVHAHVPNPFVTSIVQLLESLVLADLHPDRNTRRKT